MLIIVLSCGWAGCSPGQVGVGPGAGGGCTDESCFLPYICNHQSGQCELVGEEGQIACDPIEGKVCAEGKVCIAGRCVDPPESCETNEDCPAGFRCEDDQCVPLQEGGCITEGDCPGGQVCVNGSCTPEDDCLIAHAPDRLAGSWVFDSQLDLRDGLDGIAGNLIKLSGSLQEIVDGKFQISGLPGFISDAIMGLVQSVTKSYVPAWGFELIAMLAEIDDVIDQTRVTSVETLQAVGEDQYAGVSSWIRVEFDYKGQQVSSAPENIPGLGSVASEGYSAREVCGTLFIDSHEVRTAMGKILGWAIKTMMIHLPCATTNAPCYGSLQAMLQDMIDCDAIGDAAEGIYPGLKGLVASACTSAVVVFGSKLIEELDELTVKLDYLSLAGTAQISTDDLLSGGQWSGALGGAFGKGNFQGTFTGHRQ